MVQDTFPSFPFRDPGASSSRLSLSYGDPHGGSYPDPDLFHDDQGDINYDDLVDEEIEEDSFIILPPDPALIQSVGDGAEDDDDFTEAQARSDSLSDVDLDMTEFPSSGSEGEYGVSANKSKQMHRRSLGTPTRGIGSGRGRRWARGRGGGAQRGAKRSRSQAFGTSKRVSKRSKKAKSQEQTTEFKRLNALVTDAWLKQDYDTALKHALEAIKVDPDVFPLHATIAEILVIKGRYSDAIGALFTGVQTSKLTENWWYVIEGISNLSENPEDDRKKLIYCYTSIIRLQPENQQARLGRMKAVFEHGSYRRAKADCLAVLGTDPNNTEALKWLAELAIVLNEPDEAFRAFDSFFSTHMKANSPSDSAITWELASTYIELLMQLESPEEAVKQLKIISRWLLARGEETFWDSIEDDREWDLEHQPRRAQVSAFQPNKYSLQTYGLGLPIEFRVRLGKLRILLGADHFDEAMIHLNFLYPDEQSDIIQLEEYADLFKDAADALRENGSYSEALRFYEPLRKVSESIDPAFYFDLAICYQALGEVDKVREAIQYMKQGEKTASTQIGMAKLYESQGRLDLMWRICCQLRRAGKLQLVRQAGLPTKRPDGVSTLAVEEKTVSKVKHNKRKPQKRRPKEHEDTQTQIRDEVVRTMYEDVLLLREGVVKQDEQSVEQYLNLGSELFEEFRSNPAFFPRDRKTRFAGFGRAKQAQNQDSVLDNVLPFSTDKYRRVQFEDWVGFLMHYAMQLAMCGKERQSNTVLDVAARANIVWAEPQRLDQLRAISLRCAVITNNEVRLSQDLRWFSRTYAFSTDATHLAAAAYRVIHNQPSVFQTGPEQKFALRRIRIMDYAILSTDKKFADLKAKLFHHDLRSSDEYKLTHHEAPLLVQYGHLMLGGTAPLSALNYYFRAYAIRPEDPTLNLCIGISYISLAIKRQSSNRQFQIQQGLAFVRRYYELRQQSDRLHHHQEADFNMAMVWHSLGLFHLAMPAFGRCIELSEQIQEEARDNKVARAETEDFAAEAALAIRSIMAFHGDYETAEKVTRKHLVL